MTAIDKVYYEDVLEDDILNLLKPYIQGKKRNFISLLIILQLI